jgi:hypothetical protein
MTTTNFDSHAGDGEALAANGGTSLDLPTSKMPSPRQGHPFQKGRKIRESEQEGGGGAPLGVRGGVCGWWARSSAGDGDTGNGHRTDSEPNQGRATATGHQANQETHTRATTCRPRGLGCHQYQRPQLAMLTDSDGHHGPRIRPHSFGLVWPGEWLPDGRGLMLDRWRWRV